MGNKVQKYFVLDSMGKEHDVVAWHADCVFEHGNLLVRFYESSDKAIAVFFNPICFSTYV